MSGSVEKLVREKPLYGIFTAVPPRYDLINRVVTWGLDQRWRAAAAVECLASRPQKALDLCCGTADLAIDISRLADYELEITGIDYSRPMLELAGLKAQTAGQGRILFRLGDAADLPFPDEYFDCVGISFAMRNLTYRNPLAAKHISETLRVLAPSGRFVIVESSQPQSGLIRRLFHVYLRWFVHGVGWMLSGNRGAYHYLAESAVRYYRPEELKSLLLEAGFSEVTHRPLFLGVAGVTVAVK